ncbi:hypothetical protein BGZ83_003307 [Gryganskiella cystojenkinii]|nr:hypothetical protein BGZ83_003307 [Gryganskiella cystojenkinii]
MAPQQSKEQQQSRIFDLKYQLKEYATHHNNSVNIGIHLTCIPLIVWSALIFAAKTGPLFSAPSASAAGGVLLKLYQTLPPNLSILWMAAYCIYYIKLDKFAGLIATPFFMGAAKHATHFLASNPNAAKIATLVQIFAWSAQFIGHGVFEKRAPKLLDNLLQALVLGPYFVVYEVLFSLGYRPKLKAELNRMVEIDIREWKARKAAATAEKGKVAGNHNQ